MKKVALVLSLLFASQAFAEVTAERPYGIVGTSKNLEMYLGLYGSSAPRINKYGVTILQTILLATDARNGIAKGAREEDIIAVNCDRQVAKNLPISVTPYEGADPVSRYTTIADADAALEALPFESINSNSLFSMAIDVGCAYVKNAKPVAEKKVAKTKPDVQI